MHLKGVCWEADWFFSHLKDSHDREEKKKEKTNRHPSVSMGGLPYGCLFETYPTQYSRNLRTRHSPVRVQIPRKAET